LALTDQAVVSAANFLTTVIIGRATQPTELGLYSIGLTLIASCLCVQEALISTPYTVQRHHSPGTPAEWAGASLAQTGLLSVLIAVILLAAACVLAAVSASPGLIGLFWALVALTPFLILREFVRRFAFAHLRIAEALILDTAGAVVQVTALVGLASTGQMSAVAACAALGAAAALTGLAWLYVGRSHFTVRTDQIPVAVKHSWALGRWLFANQLVLVIQTSVVYWLLAWLGGMSATGIYTACMSIALFSNPFILAASNLLVPKLAVAWTEGGSERLRRESVQASLALAVALALFCAAVALFGDVAMRFLYPGQEYAGQAQTVTVLALGMLAMAVGMPANCALTGAERPHVIFWTAIWAAAVTAVLIWCLMPTWGLLGAAYGVFGGNLVRTSVRWVTLLLLLSGKWPARDAAGNAAGSVSLRAYAFRQAKLHLSAASRR
jgi:O-antigen/teichoic acid export membrane protein